MQIRPLFISLHRYVGLTIAIFLLVAGLTGSLLAFYHQLDVALNPELHSLGKHAGTPPEEYLDPFTLREKVAQQTGLSFNVVPLSAEPHQAIAFFGRPADGENESDLDDEFFVNPVNGEIIGSRKWGDIWQGKKNLLPFVYRLHYQLALGQFGSLLFGVVALLWTIDCFVGAYLTFPPRTKSNSKPRKTWLSRWLPAWLVRGGSLFKFTFTWHRASGLWVWGLLFVFAWSAVGLNLNQVYRPVMTALLGMNKYGFEVLPKLEQPLNQPTGDWKQAHQVGMQLLDQEASKHGVEVLAVRRMIWQPALGLFRLQVRTSRDVSSYGRSALYFDPQQSEAAYFGMPTGRQLGTTASTWLYALHFADVGGMPYKILVAITGILTAILSVSGVYIWWKKFRSRRLQSKSPVRRTARPDAQPEPSPTAEQPAPPESPAPASELPEEQALV